MHRGELAGRFSEVEMTWLLYCAGAATVCMGLVIEAKNDWCVARRLAASTSFKLQYVAVFCTSVVLIIMGARRQVQGDARAPPPDSE